jgi:hypothetical protein
MDRDSKLIDGVLNSSFNIRLFRVPRSLSIDSRWNDFSVLVDDFTNSDLAMSPVNLEDLSNSRSGSRRGHGNWQEAALVVADIWMSCKYILYTAGIFYLVMVKFNQ